MIQLCRQETIITRVQRVRQQIAMKKDFLEVDLVGFYM